MDFISFLLELVNDPVAYGIVFFLYAVAAAVFLPIPVEIGLFNTNVHPVLLVIVLAAGKAVGSFIVYYIGIGVRKTIKKWSDGTPFTKKIVDACERFVLKYGYVGLFIIMSIPLMIDSATLYLFSLLNTKGDDGRALQMPRFVLINFFAGILRGSIVLAVFYFIGIRLL
jgi:membrane protein YqaA with SNARE-associated domain